MARDVLTPEERTNLETFSSAGGVAAHDGGNLFSVEQRIVLKHFSASARILDLGCGTGRTTGPLAAMGFRPIGIDFSEPMVRKAKLNFPQTCFAVGNAAELCLRDQSVDVVLFSFNGIDYLFPEDRRLQALREIHRVLKPGGLLVMSAHNSWGVVSRRSGLRYYKWLWRFLRRNTRQLASPAMPNAKGNYLTDTTANGDLRTYFINPVQQVGQLGECGFRVVDVVGYFRGLLIYLEPWPYYVARKIDASS